MLGGRTHVPLEKVKGEKEERREKRRKGGGGDKGRKKIKRDAGKKKNIEIKSKRKYYMPRANAFFFFCNGTIWH